jgi:serine phosphatase RsbU (regulator of sigma subunit)
MVKVAFQAQAGHSEGPARVLTGMNRMLGHRLDGQFVTAGYACIDTSRQTLRYAAAAHPPLYIKNRGDAKIEKLQSNGLMLGPFPEAEYQSSDRQLTPGDRILMYTDGISEASNARGEEFGDDRIENLMAAGDDLSADQFADRLLQEVKAWSGGARVAPADDLTLIVIDLDPDNPVPAARTRSA